jgi:hypothetical protein
MLVGACAGCWEKSWILVVPCASVVLAAVRKVGCKLVHVLAAGRKVGF